MPLALRPGRRRGRAPRVRRPAARLATEPLAEGGFVRRTLLTLAALIMVAALLVPAAVAARVSVRFEGRPQSLYGALETRFEAGAHALQALDAASLRGEF